MQHCKPTSTTINVQTRNWVPLVLLCAVLSSKRRHTQLKPTKTSEHHELCRGITASACDKRHQGIKLGNIPIEALRPLVFSWKTSFISHTVFSVPQLSGEGRRPQSSWPIPCLFGENNSASVNVIWCQGAFNDTRVFFVMTRG